MFFHVMDVSSGMTVFVVMQRSGYTAYGLLRHVLYGQGQESRSRVGVGELWVEYDQLLTAHQPQRHHPPPTDQPQHSRTDEHPVASLHRARHPSHCHCVCGVHVPHPRTPHPLRSHPGTAGTRTPDRSCWIRLQ